MSNVVDCLPPFKRRSEIDVLVGRRLRRARQSLRLSGSQVADRIGGLTQVTISNYECGRTKISAGMLARFAKAYGRSIGWFFANIPDVASDDTYSHARVLRPAVHEEEPLQQAAE